MPDKVQKKREELQVLLERWAKREEILKPGERLVFKLDVVKTPLVGDMSVLNYLEMEPDAFFGKRNLEDLGVPKRSSTRLSNAFHYCSWRFVHGEGDVAIYKTVREFFKRFRTRRDFGKIKNLGEQSLGDFFDAMERAGIHIPG